MTDESIDDAIKMLRTLQKSKRRAICIGGGEVKRMKAGNLQTVFNHTQISLCIAELDDATRHPTLGKSEGLPTGPTFIVMAPYSYGPV